MSDRPKLHRQKSKNYIEKYKKKKKKTLQIWPLKSRTDYDGQKKRFYERKVHINEDDKLIYQFRDNKLSPI